MQIWTKQKNIRSNQWRTTEEAKMRETVRVGDGVRSLFLLDHEEVREHKTAINGVMGP